MWRSLFVAIGAYLCILGGECLIIDKAVLAGPPSESKGVLPAKSGTARVRELVPPDWAPWSLLSSGAVTMLYSFTIPRRVGSGK